jgi:hypothetical protein
LNNGLASGAFLETRPEASSKDIRIGLANGGAAGSGSFAASSLGLRIGFANGAFAVKGLEKEAARLPAGWLAGAFLGEGLDAVPEEAAAGNFAGLTADAFWRAGLAAGLEAAAAV